MKKNPLDILYELLVAPSKAMGYISRGKPLGWAIITAMFISIVLALSVLPNPSQLIEVVFDIERGSFNLGLAVLLWAILFPAALFTESGIYHLIVWLLKNRGSYIGMVCGLCFACFPFVFFAPLTFIRALLEAGGPAFYAITYPVVFLWAFFLTINTIRINYNCSFIRAAVVYFLPGILLLFLPLFIITVLIPL